MTSDRLMSQPSTKLTCLSDKRPKLIRGREKYLLSSMLMMMICSFAHASIHLFFSSFFLFVAERRRIPSSRWFLQRYEEKLRKAQCNDVWLSGTTIKHRKMWRSLPLRHLRWKKEKRRRKEKKRGCWSSSFFLSLIEDWLMFRRLFSLVIRREERKEEEKDKLSLRVRRKRKTKKREFFLLSSLLSLWNSTRKNRLIVSFYKFPHLYSFFGAARARSRRRVRCSHTLASQRSFIWLSLISR